MGQCEKMEKGERCSNQAIPGTKLCSTHKRISFRKMQEDQAADTAPPPKAKKPAARARKQKKQKVWQAHPSPSGEVPQFPNLQADGRNILVGAEGMVWLSDDQDNEGQTPLFTRLVKLLGFLSDGLSLHGQQEEAQVRILQQAKTGDYLLHLQPHQTEADNLSTFYDTASTAARLVDGRLYVGQENAYVQYRDDSAPRGYDVANFKAADQAKGLLLIAHWGSRTLDLSTFNDLPLADFALAVAPVPDSVGALPDRIYVLAAHPLYAVLARYFRAHSLHYRLARLLDNGEEQILFEVQPNPEAKDEPVIPAFVLDYLSHLPRVGLLVRVGDAPTVLLQWGHRYPLNLPHLLGAFAPEVLLILSHTPYVNCCVRPAPQFLDGDRLTDVYVAQREQQSVTLLDVPPSGGMEALDAAETPTLRLPILLRPDYGPVPPIAALILSPQETRWLRPLLYRLPGDALADYLLCQGENLSVLVGGTTPIEGIPFGIPLQRLADTELFLPLRSRFVPALSWPILREALHIKDDVFTFITETSRLDLAKDDFRPLSRIIVAQKRGPDFLMQTLATMPDLKWEPRTPPAVSPPISAPIKRSGASETSEATHGETTTPPRIERVQGDGAPVSGLPPSISRDDLHELMGGNVGEWIIPKGTGEEEVDMTRFLKAQAVQHEQKGDRLSAAFCYELLGDTTNSARCFRLSGAGGSAS